MKRTIIITIIFVSLVACKEKQTKTPQKSVVKEEKAFTITDVITPNTPIIELASNLQFLEGPIWDSNNNRLIFSEVNANKLHQWSADKGLEVYLEPSWYAGGNVFDNEGNIISCQGGARQLAKISPDKTMEVLVNDFNGKKFNSPNDVVVKSDGTIWFTDPDYGLLAVYGEDADAHKELDAFHIFKYDPKTKEVVSVDSSLSKPNGLVFSKDETKLYVGNSEEGDRKLVVFDVTEGGALANKTVLSGIESSSWGIDGLKMDNNGNLYAACGDGVNVFSPNGKLIGKITTAFEVTNLCFGGDENKTLFMTGHSSLHSVKLNIVGK